MAHIQVFGSIWQPHQRTDQALAVSNGVLSGCFFISYFFDTTELCAVSLAHVQKIFSLSSVINLGILVPGFDSKLSDPIALILASVRGLGPEAPP